MLDDRILLLLSFTTVVNTWFSFSEIEKTDQFANSILHGSAIARPFSATKAENGGIFCQVDNDDAKGGFLSFLLGSMVTIG